MKIKDYWWENELSKLLHDYSVDVIKGAYHKSEFEIILMVIKIIEQEKTKWKK